MTTDLNLWREARAEELQKVLDEVPYVEMFIEDIRPTLNGLKVSWIDLTNHEKNERVLQLDKVWKQIQKAFPPQMEYLFPEPETMPKLFYPGAVLSLFLDVSETAGRVTSKVSYFFQAIFGPSREMRRLQNGVWFLQQQVQVLDAQTKQLTVQVEKNSQLIQEMEQVETRAEELYQTTQKMFVQLGVLQEEESISSSIFQLLRERAADVIAQDQAYLEQEQESLHQMAELLKEYQELQQNSQHIDSRIEEIDQQIQDAFTGGSHGIPTNRKLTGASPGPARKSAPIASPDSRAECVS